MTLNGNIVVSKNCPLLVLETVYTMSNMYKVYEIAVGPLGSSFFFLPRPRGEHGNKKINRYVYTMSNMYKVYEIAVGPLGSSFFFLPRPRGENGNKKINRYACDSNGETVAAHHTARNPRSAMNAMMGALVFLTDARSTNPLMRTARVEGGTYAELGAERATAEGDSAERRRRSRTPSDPADRTSQGSRSCQSESRGRQNSAQGPGVGDPKAEETTRRERRSSACCTLRPRKPGEKQCGRTHRNY
ncbi:hypothetical protein NDU88_001052 [Pleurodeles waltl]|uniref:Uncharacterized protein n=1 Tax=Pleurodeles waltl TaxID=8319 RepID=A0AAV7UT68_PLEWA|nr:hypothetical protein NDU88_001052 [Pleurodeles waltl]